MEKIELIRYNAYYKINLPDEKYRGKGEFYSTYVRAPYFDKKTSSYKDVWYAIHFYSSNSKDNRKGMGHERRTSCGKNKEPESNPFSYYVMFPTKGQKKTEYFCALNDLNMLEYDILNKAIEDFNREMKERIRPYTVKIIASRKITLTGEYAEWARIFENIPHDKWHEYIGEEELEEFIEYIEETTGIKCNYEDDNEMTLLYVLSKDGSKKLIDLNDIDFNFSSDD